MNQIFDKITGNYLWTTSVRYGRMHYPLLGIQYEENMELKIDTLARICGIFLRLTRV